MFQRLDELQTGSLYILTGQAGAGKSHLAASARRLQCAVYRSLGRRERW